MGTLVTDLHFCKRRTKIYSSCLLNGRSRSQSCKSLLIVVASIWKISQGNASSFLLLIFLFLSDVLRTCNTGGHGEFFGGI